MNDVNTIYMWDLVTILAEELNIEVTYYGEQFHLSTVDVSDIFLSPTVPGVYAFLKGYQHAKI